MARANVMRLFMRGFFSCAAAVFCNRYGNVLTSGASQGEANSRLGSGDLEPWRTLIGIDGGHESLNAVLQFILHSRPVALQLIDKAALKDEPRCLRFRTALRYAMTAYQRSKAANPPIMSRDVAENFANILAMWDGGLMLSRRYTDPLDFLELFQYCIKGDFVGDGVKIEEEFSASEIGCSQTKNVTVRTGKVAVNMEFRDGLGIHLDAKTCKGKRTTPGRTRIYIDMTNQWRQSLSRVADKLRRTFSTSPRRDTLAIPQEWPLPQSAFVPRSSAGFDTRYFTPDFPRGGATFCYQDGSRSFEPTAVISAFRKDTQQVFNMWKVNNLNTYVIRKNVDDVFVNVASKVGGFSGDKRLKIPEDGCVYFPVEGAEDPQKFCVKVMVFGAVGVSSDFSSGGHYTSAAKINGQWQYFNDAWVEPWTFAQASEKCDQDCVLLAFRKSGSGPSTAVTNAKGLPNIGNTCFMNALLQMILHTPLALQQLKSISETNRPDGLEEDHWKRCLNLKTRIEAMEQKYRGQESFGREDMHQFQREVGPLVSPDGEGAEDDPAQALTAMATCVKVNEEQGEVSFIEPAYEYNFVEVNNCDPKMNDMIRPTVGTPCTKSSDGCDCILGEKILWEEGKDSSGKTIYGTCKVEGKKVANEAHRGGCSFWEQPVKTFPLFQLTEDTLPFDSFEQLALSSTKEAGNDPLQVASLYAEPQKWQRKDAVLSSQALASDCHYLKAVVGDKKMGISAFTRTDEYVLADSQNFLLVQVTRSRFGEPRPLTIDRELTLRQENGNGETKVLRLVSAVLQDLSGTEGATIWTIARRRDKKGNLLDDWYQMINGQPAKMVSDQSDEIETDCSRHCVLLGYELVDKVSS